MVREPSGSHGPRGALALARAMAKTIAGGTRTLDLVKGERRLCTYSQTKSVFVTLPAGYLLSEQQGIDFTVQHVRKMALLGDGGATSGVSPTLSVYLGDHPSGGDSGSKANGTAVVFGQKIDLSQQSSEQGGRKMIAARSLVKLGSDLQGPGSQTRQGPSYVDVFMNASNEAEIEELKSIAATLRIGDPIPKP
jgi:hypothetical protein